MGEENGNIYNMQEMQREDPYIGDDTNERQSITNIQMPILPGTCEDTIIVKDKEKDIVVEDKEEDIAIEEEYIKGQTEPDIIQGFNPDRCLMHNMFCKFIIYNDVLMGSNPWQCIRKSECEYKYLPEEGEGDKRNKDTAYLLKILELSRNELRKTATGNKLLISSSFEYQKERWEAKRGMTLEEIAEHDTNKYRMKIEEEEKEGEKEEETSFL